MLIFRHRTDAPRLVRGGNRCRGQAAARWRSSEIARWCSAGITRWRARGIIGGVFISLLVASGCGQKGPLFLPEKSGRVTHEAKIH